MKKYVSAVIALIIFASCTKSDVVAPKATAEETTENLFYKDAYVAIANVKAVTSGDNIEFQFTSLYEKNVSKIEVVSGPYENIQCFFYEQALSAASLTAKEYKITEAGAASSIRYYFIKYTLKSGVKVSSPAFKYQG